MVKNLFFLLLWESFYGNPFMGIQSVMRRYNSHYIHPYMELLSSEQDLFSLKMIPGHFFCTFPACLWKWRLSAKLDIWQHTVHTAVTAWKGQQHLHIKIMWPESGLTNQKKKKKESLLLKNSPASSSLLWFLLSRTVSLERKEETLTGSAQVNMHP